MNSLHIAPGQAAGVLVLQLGVLLHKEMRPAVRKRVGRSHDQLCGAHGAALSTSSFGQLTGALWRAVRGGGGGADLGTVFGTTECEWDGGVCGHGVHLGWV